jgi:hypothetical protein
VCVCAGALPALLSSSCSAAASLTCGQMWLGPAQMWLGPARLWLGPGNRIDIGHAGAPNPLPAPLQLVGGHVCATVNKDSRAVARGIRRLSAGGGEGGVLPLGVRADIQGVHLEELSELRHDTGATPFSARIEPRHAAGLAWAGGAGGDVPG